MTIDGSPHTSPAGRGPWWLAAAGGGGGITAAVVQDHTLGWVLLAAFVAWLIHDILIAWVTNRAAPGHDRPSGPQHPAK